VIDSTGSAKSFFWPTFFGAIALGFVAGMAVTGHFLGKGNVGGPFGWIGPLFLTLYVGAIAAALVWFPLLAISQLIQRPRPRQWWMQLVLPIAAFVCAAPIPLKEVAKWWAARRVEQQTRPTGSWLDS